MKKYLLVNIESEDARLVSKRKINHCLRKCKKQAKKVLKRSGAQHVLYAVMYDADGKEPSCHILPPHPFTNERFVEIFPKSDSTGTPLLVSRK